MIKHLSIPLDEESTELLPCKCGSMPVQETETHMLGRIEDGGYSVTIGRYKCPACGHAPNWGKCYSIYCGWGKNITVWNRSVQHGNSQN